MKKIPYKFMFSLATFALGISAAWFANNIYPPLPEIDLPESEELISNVACVCPPEPAQYTPLHIPRLKNTRLAFPGEALNDEKPTTGFEEGWLALYKTKIGYEMRKTRVRVTLHQTDFDDDCNAASLRKYRVAERRKPIFMIKGIPGVKIGKAMVEYNDLGDPDIGDNYINLNYYNPSSPHKYGFLGKVYKFDVEGAQPPDSQYQSGGAIFFSSGALRQKLYQPPQSQREDAERETDKFENYSIPWMGDIDSDGKLDIMLRLGRSYPGGYENRYVLYISTQAREGELVAPVAAFESYVMD